MGTNDNETRETLAPSVTAGELISALEGMADACRGAAGAVRVHSTPHGSVFGVPVQPADQDVVRGVLRLADVLAAQAGVNRGGSREEDTPRVANGPAADGMVPDRHRGSYRHVQLASRASDGKAPADDLSFSESDFTATSFGAALVSNLIEKRRGITESGPEEKEQANVVAVKGDGLKSHCFPPVEVLSELGDRRCLVDGEGSDVARTHAEETAGPCAQGQEAVLDHDASPSDKAVVVHSVRKGPTPQVVVNVSTESLAGVPAEVVAERIAVAIEARDIVEAELAAKRDAAARSGYGKPVR